MWSAYRDTSGNLAVTPDGRMMTLGNAYPVLGIHVWDSIRNHHSIIGVIDVQPLEGPILPNRLAAAGAVWVRKIVISRRSIPQRYLGLIDLDPRGSSAIYWNLVQRWEGRAQRRRRLRRCPRHRSA